MKFSISKFIISIIYIFGIFAISVDCQCQINTTQSTFKIQRIYESPDYYCIIAEDIISAERFIIETSNQSLPSEDRSNDFIEINPNEPNLIHVGDTLRIEIAPKYEFMQSMIGQSYMHMPDCPAYRYREISSKNSTQPWPMTSPNLNGLQFVPSVDKSHTFNARNLRAVNNTFVSITFGSPKGIPRHTPKKLKNPLRLSPLRKMASSVIDPRCW